MHFSFHDFSFQQISENPNKIALIGSDESLSWAEFHHRTQQLVQLLLEHLSPKGKTVILYGHKECAMIIAKTALMQVGAIYIPTDIIFPIERIQRMKEQADVEILLNCTDNTEIENIFPTVIQVSENRIVKKGKGTPPTLKNPLDAENPIKYILFTSGSTGLPKGVPIAEKGITKFAEWITSSFQINTEDVLLNISSLSFDFASFDEYLFLQSGASLVLTPSHVIKESKQLLAHISNAKASVWISTPGLVFLYLTEPLFNAVDLPHIHSFVFAGESLPLRTYHELRKRFPKANIWNAFGPSEATNLTTSILLTDEIVNTYNAIPIGYPKPDSAVFIIDPDKDGLGEIGISGIHLTPGYLKNEALNQEKFKLINGNRTYLSGDQGYIRDGIIFYAGRNDDMVKFHGYRIELEDISSTLKDYPAISNATTIGLKNKGEVKKIVAFYCSQVELENKILQAYLQSKLPEYMIPSDFVQIPEIPLTSSDKIDKKKLEEFYIHRKSVR